MNPVSINITQELQALAPVRPTDELLVAISGGLDSVALANFCHEAGYSIKLIHCNFQLRGEESNRDELLVQSLAKTLKVAVLVKHFDTAAYAAQHKLSIQEAARQLRYNWFSELLENDKSTQWLLTAHHSDDNVETIAMHFFRGTGLAGLTGIPSRNGRILRPLLRFSRKELSAYVTSRNLPFAEDSSNAKEEYTRNYFRHTLLPAIEKVYPEVRQNMLDNATRFVAIKNLYRNTVDKLIQKIVRKSGEEFTISIGQLNQYKDSSLLYEILTPFGFSAKQTLEASQLITAHSGAFIQAAHKPWRLIRHRNWLVLAPGKQEQLAYILINSASDKVHFGTSVLQLEEIDMQPDKLPVGPLHVWLDSRKLQFPLLLRKWKEGDYFYPLGMTRKKKISRFLIDQKRSTTEKEKTWVLESAGRIIWVVADRIDDRFKIKPSTQKVLSLQLIP